MAFGNLCLNMSGIKRILRIPASKSLRPDSVLCKRMVVSLNPTVVIMDRMCGRGLDIFRRAVCRKEKVPGLSMKIWVGC